MENPRTLYEVLGVPREAEAAEIRRAFRRIVRRIHPDVAANKQEAHDAFIEVRHAYGVLSDTGRRLLYDLALEPATPPEASQAPKSPPTAPPRSVADLLAAAESDLRAGHLAAARSTLRDVFGIEEENPDAALLLARVMEAEGGASRAMQLLEAAAQRFPTHYGLRQALNNARRAEASRSPVRASRARDATAGRRTVLWVSLAAGAASIASGFVLTGEPLPWLPVLPDVPWPLIRGPLGAGAALGFGLAASGSFPALEDELIWANAAGCTLARPLRSWEPPLGVVLPLMALLNWVAALVLWLVMSEGRGVFSRSLAAAFAIGAGLAGVAALGAPASAVQLALWLSGWCLTAVFAGWLAGDFFRP